MRRRHTSGVSACSALCMRKAMRRKSLRTLPGLRSMDLCWKASSPRNFLPPCVKAAGSKLVIEIAKDPVRWRWKPAPIVAIAGVAPSGRNLSEMGIRGAPSSEPWIESNIWLVRSFAFVSLSRAVWISSQLENASAIDYARAVADAAAAGGRWIVSLDDTLRTKLRARDPSALETWRRLSSYLKFAESHAAWRALVPYGNVGIVVDPASTKQELRRGVPESRGTSPGALPTGGVFRAERRCSG